MEDAHISCTDLAAIDSSVNDDNISVFGVFDGHGGKEVAKFCQVYFLRELIHLENFYDRNFGDALKQTFHKMDLMLEDEVTLQHYLIWKLVFTFR
jgi:protein phosphatase 1G